MTRRRRWILSSLGLAALVGGLAYWTLPPGRHYRLFRDEASLLTVLSQTESGTELSTLEGLLGPPHIPHEQRQQKLLAGYERLADDSPQTFPDGVTKRDRFVDYRADNTGVTLQLRDGMLVNFESSHFEHPLEPVKLLHSLEQ